MKKSLLLLFFGIGLLPIFSQTSWESNIGFNKSFDKMDGGYNEFYLNDSKRYGFTLNSFLNFRENKLLCPKLGLTYNYDYLLVNYNYKNSGGNGNYGIYNTTIEHKKHLIKVSGMLKLNFFEFGNIKINPQIGMNVNFIEKSKSSQNVKEDSYNSGIFSQSTKNYYDSYRGLNFNFELIGGLQFEKNIKEKLSLIAEINYLRNFYGEDKFSYNEFYDVKNEFRLSAGIKRKIGHIIIPIAQTPQNSFYFSVDLFRTPYKFVLNEEYSNSNYSSGNFISSSGKYNTLHIKQEGISIGFGITENKFYLSSAVNISTINFELDYSSSYTSTPKMGPTFLNNSGESYYLYTSRKNEIEFSFSLGYDILKNNRLSLIPQFGFGLLTASPTYILKDEVKSHSHSETFSFGPPPTSTIIITQKDTYYEGKASSSIIYGSQKTFYPRISVLTLVKLTPKINLRFTFTKLIGLNSQLIFQSIKDSRKYQYSVGISYKIK